MISRIGKTLYELYKNGAGRSILFYSTLLYIIVVVLNPVITDRSELKWDYGYLEDVEWSERKGKYFYVVYSEKFKKIRSFSPISLLNENELKEKIQSDSYYDRKVKIGWDTSWLDGLISSEPTAGLTIYEFEYRGDVLLSFEDSSKMMLERGENIYFYIHFIFLIINLPYLLYLFLMVGVKFYGWRK